MQSPGRNQGVIVKQCAEKYVDHDVDCPDQHIGHCHCAGRCEGKQEFGARAILKFMALTDYSPRVGNDPKSVMIHLTTGTGMEIEWKDGHRSVYTFAFLRDACPCALCEDERGKSGRKPGVAAKLPPGALPMFKPAAKELLAEAVGKYALKFSWNDRHDLGIYSRLYLREGCPCAECMSARKERVCCRRMTVVG